MKDTDKNNTRKIEYFSLEGSQGGNQEWCRDFWMYLGGCAALAACDMSICLWQNHGISDCIPFEEGIRTREDYVQFSTVMKPYIHPRINGVTKLSIFTEGYGKYLKDRGLESSFSVCPGEESADSAYAMIEDSVGRNLPAACLILRHKDPYFKDLNWHWFSVTGCSREGDRRFIYFHTYGAEEKVDFDNLWNTGFRYRGGLVTIKKVWKP